MIAPGELSLIHQQLVGEYGGISVRLGEILMAKPAIWASMRLDKTSDSQTDKAWEATEMGKDETIYRLQLKTLEKILSSIKTRISVLQGEARNQY